MTQPTPKQMSTYKQQLRFYKDMYDPQKQDKYMHFVADSADAWIEAQLRKAEEEDRHPSGTDEVLVGYEEREE